MYGIRGEKKQIRPLSLKKGKDKKKNKKFKLNALNLQIYLFSNISFS